MNIIPCIKIVDKINSTLSLTKEGSQSITLKELSKNIISKGLYGVMAAKYIE